MEPKGAAHCQAGTVITYRLNANQGPQGPAGGATGRTVHQEPNERDEASRVDHIETRSLTPVVTSPADRKIAEIG